MESLARHFKNFKEIAGVFIGDFGKELESKGNLLCCKEGGSEYAGILTQDDTQYLTSWAFMDSPFHRSWGCCEHIT